MSRHKVIRSLIGGEKISIISVFPFPAFSSHIINKNVMKLGIFQAIERYPVLGITLSLKSVAGRNIEVKGKGGRGGGGGGGPPKWIEVAADTEYTVNVNMRRMNRPAKGADERRAFAPRFPKPKDEGWFLVLGSVEVHSQTPSSQGPHIT